MARAPSPRREAERGREPWLEEAEPELAEATLIGRRTLWALVAALLLLVGVVAAGLWLITGKADGPSELPAGGDVPLVASPGPWRVPAAGPGVEGEPVEGQGQLLFPAGEGQLPEGRIDPDRLPEEPVPLPAPPPAGSPGPPTDLLGPPEVTNWPESEPAGGPPRPGRRTPEAPPSPPSAQPRPAPEPGPAPAAPPAPSPAPAAGPAGAGVVQLGAFSSEAAARRAFANLAARHPELRGVSPQISRTEGSDGQPLWRVRASLGPAISPGAFCDRLRVAGDACAPVR